MELEPEELQSLRALFLEEARDYASSISDALAQLELQADDAGALGAMMRKAHTLKGAAGAVAATKIGELAHQLEDEVLAYQRGDRATRTLAAIRAISDTLAAELDALEHRLERARRQALTAAHQHIAVENQRRDDLELGDDVLHALGVPSLTDAELSERRRRQDRRLVERRREGDPFSVRVEVERLEELMDATSELVIVRSRFARRLDEVNDAIRELSPLDRAQLSAPDHVRVAQTLATLTRCAAQTRDDIDELDRTFRTLNDSIRRAKLMPVRRLFQRLQAAVTEWARRDGKLVRVVTEGDDSEVDKVLVERLVEPLVHLLRNAVAHGIERPGVRLAHGKPEVGEISIAARLSPQHLELEVADDGGGLDIEGLRFQLMASGQVADAAALDDDAVLDQLFAGGVSTRGEVDSLAGRGVGLATVKDALTALDGELNVHAKRDAGTSFVMRIPIATVVQEALLFKLGGQVYGVPTASVSDVMEISSADITLGPPDRWRSLPLLRTGALLALPTPPFARDRRFAVILKHAGNAFAITCDKVIGARQIVLRSLGPVLAPLDLYDGATISGAGKVQLMLNVAQLHAHAAAGVRAERPAVRDVAKRILVVDDSRTVRDTVSKMLERLGYVVESVVDGWAAWDVLQDRAFDLVVTDLEMPGLDGYELIGKLRRERDLQQLPVIVLTAQATESARTSTRQSGANAFLCKPTNATELGDVVADMLRSRA